MISKDEKIKIIGQYKKSDNDTGSVEVQIALLTQHIQSLTQHCQNNKKDFSSKRGLLIMVSKRRKLLSYLHKNEPEAYQKLVKPLGIRA